MAEFHERIFELAMHELAEQERQVSELRNRVSPLLAAGAVVASLLAKAAFASHHHWDQWVAIAVGIIGGVVLLAGALVVILPSSFGFSVNAPDAAQIMWREGLVEQPGVDFALAEALHQRRELNRTSVDRLTGALTVAVIALGLEAVGFALAAALAS